MGDHVVVVVGLWGSYHPADPLFRDLKGRNLLRVPHFSALRTHFKGVPKSLVNPIQNMRSQGILAVQLLANILRSWHWGSWNSMPMVYLRHLCRIWLFSHLRDPHQWWWAFHLQSLLVIVSSAPFLMGEK